MFDVAKAVEDLKFDRSNLDEVWSNHAVVFFEYTEKLTLAERKVAQAKQIMDEVEAKVYASVRADLSLSGIRPTESLIDAKVRNHELVKKARQKHDDAKQDAERCKYAIEAFRHRRDMIVQASKRELLDLEKTGSSSFSGSKITRGEQ